VSGKQSSVPIFRHSARIDEIVAPFCNLKQCESTTVKRPARESRNSTFMSALVFNGHCGNSINVRYSPEN